VIQDYRLVLDEQLESIEKQTLRTLVQAIQEYSREARSIFESTFAASESEVIVLAEDLVQYALEVAECYPINKRFAGYIDYKRVRWLSTPFGLFPQVLLVDAKASTENNRDTLQQSQLPMDAEFHSRGVEVRLSAGIPPHLEIESTGGAPLVAVTTSAFVHFHYQNLKCKEPPYRSLKAIFTLLLPHQRLKPLYNPNANHTFFGQGKHSPARDEAQRIRVYYARLAAACPWRLQVLRYDAGHAFATAEWRDGERGTAGAVMPFSFIGR
jgi:hypothetical protein